MDNRIRLQILLDIGLCLFPADAEILAQTERTDAVYAVSYTHLDVYKRQEETLFLPHWRLLPFLLLSEVLLYIFHLFQILV